MKRTMPTEIYFRAATGKQFDFIRSLIAERELDATLQGQIDDARSAAMRGELSTHDASGLIDALRAAPKPAEVPADGDPLHGVYRVGSSMLYRVYRGQRSGAMLAKSIRFDSVTGEPHYTYEGLASRFVVDDQRLSMEDVGKLGIASGWCLVCGRRLDDPESVDRGIGPVCAKRY